MAAFFCDTSALVKRYINETGSAWLRAAIDPKSDAYVYIARITFVEAISAFTRRQRDRHVSMKDAATARNQLEKDYLDEFFSVEITEALIFDAARLAEKYALRGYDAVQLAAALETKSERISSGLSPLTLLSADTDLNAASVSEGLIVDNPNDH